MAIKQSGAQKKNFHGNGSSRPVKTVVKSKGKGINPKGRAK